MRKDGKKIFAYEEVLDSDWSEAEPWEKLGHIGVIRDWALEIFDALATLGDADRWQLVGRAVTIIHEDVDYCRQIYKRVASDAGLQFVVIPAEKVISIFSQYGYLCDEGPQLIYLEPGPWMQKFDPETSTVDKNTFEAVQQKIMHLITESDCFPPLIIGTSTNDYQAFAPEFRQAHLFSRRFAITEPTLDQQAKDFLENVGFNICDQTLTRELHKVGKLLELEFNDKRRQGLVALAMKRLAKRASRPINFKDLVHMAVNGTLESDQIINLSEDSIRRVAIHEAGHTVIAVVDSEGSNIPDYVSALPTHAHKGVVAESFSYNLRNDDIKSYRNMRHKVRICLAGRAAEQLVLGSQEVSCYGAKDDLDNATRICNDMFGICGISPNMEDADFTGNNLIVLTSEPSLSDNIRIDRHVRTYLEKQYKIVLNELQKHRELLNNIMSELTEKQLLNQEDLIEICAKYKLNYF